LHKEAVVMQMSRLLVVLVMAGLVGVAGLALWSRAAAADVPEGAVGPVADLPGPDEPLARGPERWREREWRGGPPRPRPPVAMERIERRLADLEEELDRLAEIVGPEHPGLERLRERLERLRERVGEARRGGPERPGPPCGPMCREMHGAMKAGMKGMMMARRIETLRKAKEGLYDPMLAILAASRGIVDLAGDDPGAGIDTLRELIRKVDAPVVRTALRFALKDALERAGDRDGAIRQLAEIIEENARLVAKQRPPRRVGKVEERPAGRRPAAKERRGEGRQKQAKEHHGRPRK